MRDLLKDTFQRLGIKIDNQALASNGFATLQGILAGIALNDIWRILNLPGNNTPLAIAGVPSTMFSQDYLMQLGIGALSVAAQVLFKVDYGVSFGIGIGMGSTWANMSESGHYLGATQASPPHPPALPLPNANGNVQSLTGYPAPQPGAPWPGSGQVPQLIPSAGSVQSPPYAPYNPMGTVVPNSPLAHLP